MSDRHEQRSLFGEILDWMLAPLLLLWPMSVALTWLVAQGMTELATWTSSANVRLIRLYEKHRYAITGSGRNDGTTMVRLTKTLPVTS